VGGINTGFNKDPLLTNVGAGGTVGFGNSLTGLQAYKINSGASPANNAAQDLSAIGIDPGTVDFWGSVLPGGTLNDIGSNQHSNTLPIVLLGFHGSCMGNANEITWVTGEELNMKSIELLYSADGASYKTIAEIKPGGSNSHYSYLNENAASGNNFYQLKMNDLDGAVSYSSVIIVKCENITDKITVGPNPFSHSIYISLSSRGAGMSTLALYDTRGNILAQKKVQLQDGINPVVFDDLGHLPVGLYYLQIAKPDKVERFKLIKSAE
jgi:hypothetical protein